VGVLAVTLIELREELAAHLIRARLGQDVTFQVREVGLHGVTLSGIRGHWEAAGIDAISLDRLHVDWTLLGLWNGELRAIAARGLRARLRATDGEARPGGGQAFPGRAGGSDLVPPSLRTLDTLAVEDVQLAVHAAGMDVAVRAGLALERSPAGELAGSGVMTASWAGASALIGIWLGRAAAMRGGERGARDALAGSVYVDARLAETDRAPVRGSLAGWLSYSVDAARAELRALDCLRLRVDEVPSRRTGWLLEAVETCLAQGAGPLLRLTRRDAGIELHASVRTTSLGVSAGDATSGEPVVAAGVKSLALWVHRTAQGDAEWRLRGAGERLGLPGARVELRSWRASATLDAHGMWSGELAGDTLEDRAAPARFAPFAARAHARGSLGASRIEISMRASSASGLALEARGHHDLIDGSGELLLLEGTSHDAAAVLAQIPPLMQWIHAARGEVGVGARVAWSAERSDVRVALLPRDLDLATQWGVFQGIEGRVRLLGPEAWRTEGMQSVRARSAEYRLAVRDVSVRATLERGGVLTIDQASGRIAGGEVAVSGTYDPGAPESAFRLRVSGVDFGQVLDRVDLPGLAGTGAVGGVLPLVLGARGLELRHGELSSRDGRLRYRPSPRARALAGARPDLALAFSVLRDFSYDLLRVRMDGLVHDALETVVYVEGRNPTLEGGREVQLTLNLDARLADLLRLPALDLPEPVRDRLESRLRDPP
jgi:hypothetical protein